MREIIKQAMEAKGLTLTDVSVFLGKNKAYMQQFIERGIPQYLKETERKTISMYLSIDEDQLLPPEIKSIYSQTKNIKIPSESSLQPKVADDIENISFGPDMIPILGNANGSTEALVLNFDQPIGQILRHPNQKGMKGAFALYARGESMSPRYMPGEPVYVIANKPPQKGQDCIVEMKNGESYLKIYTKQTEAELICRQLSPDKSWKRLLMDIKSIHAVVGRG